jgi:uncharacterized protein
VTTSESRPFAVVTGASSGIGLELARQFAQNGFDLLVTATGSTIADAAANIRDLGAHVQTVQGDLSTYDGVEALYEAIRSTPCSGSSPWTALVRSSVASRWFT